MQRRQSSKHSKQPLRVHDSNQTDLSAWRKEGSINTEKNVQNQQSPSDDSKHNSLEQAVKFFEKGKRTVLRLTN